MDEQDRIGSVEVHFRACGVGSWEMERIARWFIILFVG
jgi:hypothetical protein